MVVSDMYYKILLISVSENMVSTKVVPKGTIQIKPAYPEVVTLGTTQLNPDTKAGLIILRKIQIILIERKIRKQQLFLIKWDRNKSHSFKRFRNIIKR